MASSMPFFEQPHRPPRGNPNGTSKEKPAFNRARGSTVIRRSTRGAGGAGQAARLSPISAGEAGRRPGTNNHIRRWRVKLELGINEKRSFRNSASRRWKNKKGVVEYTQTLVFITPLVRR